MSSLQAGPPRAVATAGATLRVERPRYRILRRGPVWLLIATNVLLYFVAVIDQDLFIHLALQPATWTERPWTVLTSLFIHANIWHLATNMLTLYYLGSILSKKVGNLRFLVVYFVGGIVGGFLYVLLGPAQSIAMGASGAIFAVGGTLAVTMPRMKVYVFPIPRSIPMWAAIIGIFTVVSFVPNVAWQAHLGGLVIGLGAGYFFRSQTKHH